MIRPVATELALFFAPFAIYLLYLLVTRASVFDRTSWPWAVVGWLTIAALLSVVVSFIVLAQWSGDRPGANYEPAHMEDGKLVPGRIK
jgi:hypothetical protein